MQVVLTRGEEIGLVGAANLDYSMIRCRDAVVFDGNGPVNTITGASPTYIEIRCEHHWSWSARRRRT